MVEVFRGEKGIKNAVEMMGGNSFAGIGDFADKVASWQGLFEVAEIGAIEVIDRGFDG